MGQIVNNRTGAPAGNGPVAPTPEATGAPASASRRIRIADTLAEASLAGMLGVLNGVLPLKHARAACALGELSLRSVVAGQEYDGRAPFDLPGLPAHPASGEEVDETPGTTRNS